MVSDGRTGEQPVPIGDADDQLHDHRGPRVPSCITGSMKSASLRGAVDPACEPKLRCRDVVEPSDRRRDSQHNRRCKGDRRHGSRVQGSRQQSSSPGDEHALSIKRSDERRAHLREPPLRRPPSPAPGSCPPNPRPPHQPRDHPCSHDHPNPTLTTSPRRVRQAGELRSSSGRKPRLRYSRNAGAPSRHSRVTATPSHPVNERCTRRGADVRP